MRSPTATFGRWAVHIAIWGLGIAYLVPLVMLNNDRLYPWPLGVMVYQGEYSSEWHLILAFITLTIMPTVLLFLFAQKHIVAGLTAGAVKG